MKERPILFSSPMMRAILDGRKTQTRRVVTNAKPYEPTDEGIDILWHTGQLACPYGAVGDRLWVRETWQVDDYGMQHHRADRVRYRATDGEELAWRPSIFMPRWASRITLEIVDVRVQRVKQIKDEEFVLEGFPYAPETHQEGFAYMWEKLNGKRGYGWDVNPWVWVLSFKVI